MAAQIIKLVIEITALLDIDRVRDAGAARDDCRQAVEQISQVQNTAK